MIKELLNLPNQVYFQDCYFKKVMEFENKSGILIYSLEFPSVKNPNFNIIDSTGCFFNPFEDNCTGFLIYRSFENLKELKKAILEIKEFLLINKIQNGN